LTVFAGKNGGKNSFLPLISACKIRGEIKKPPWARAASNGAVEEFSGVVGEEETLHIGGKNGQIVKVPASPHHFHRFRYDK
jgi:hypothetical protein